MRLPGDFRGRIGLKLVRNQTDPAHEDERNEASGRRAQPRSGRHPWYRRLFHRGR
jgi:hypothetical protein